MNYYNLLVVALMILTFLSILMGLYLFSFKSETHKKHGNKLMMARILFQAIAIILLLIAYNFKNR